MAIENGYCLTEIANGYCVTEIANGYCVTEIANGYCVTEIANGYCLTEIAVSFVRFGSIVILKDYTCGLGLYDIELLLTDRIISSPANREIR